MPTEQVALQKLMQGCILELGRWSSGQEGFLCKQEDLNSDPQSQSHALWVVETDGSLGLTYWLPT